MTIPRPFSLSDPLPEATSPACCERRAYLIDQELTVGLTGAETAELKRLQAAADEYLDRVHPLPLEDLTWLEKRVADLKAEGRESAGG